MTESFRILTYRNSIVPDLMRVHKGIMHESRAVLPVTLEQLTTSFTSAMSAVLVEDNSDSAPIAYGHVRFTPLLHPLLIDKLNLPPDTPQIWEMGSGFMDPDRTRGNGYYGALRNELLDLYIDQIKGGNILIIGTTKTRPVLKVLKAAEKIGLGALFAHHETYPMILPFTCTCEGDFGHGAQYGFSACHKRVSTDLIPIGTVLSPHDNDKINRLPQTDPSRPASIPCCLYVYGTKQGADRINYLLEESFGNPSNLIGQLRRPDINYYDEKTYE